jgi:predicted phage terminase large subunit-like protein
MSLDISSSAFKELIEPCIDSTAHTAVTLFEDHITRPFCPLHSTILDLLDDDSKRLVAIAAPRGFGKTTLIGLCYTARKALFRHAPYIVYISATAAEAAQKVKTLARELVENPLIKEIFGNLQGVKWAEEKGEIELVDDKGRPFCFIQAKGAGNQIRGLKWGQHRPSLFLVDDLESKDDAQSEEQRKKLKKWFFGDLLGALDNSDSSTSRVVLIGTVVHQDSLLSNLIDEKHEIDFKDAEQEEMANLVMGRERFHAVRLEACDDNYESIWPEFISTASIRARAEAYRQRGLLDIFFMEFRNMVIAGEEAAFQQSMFHYYGEHSAEFKAELEAKQIDTIVIVDPAKTANTSSDFTAIIAVGFNSITNRIYFRDCINKRLHPDEIFKEAVDMAIRFKTNVIGMEVTGLNNFVTYPFQQYIATQRHYVNLVEIKAIKAKQLRVAALVPLYRMGAVWHNEELHVRGALESQLLSFPYSKFWDVMDCLANCIDMFDIGDRSFTFQNSKGSSEDDEYERLREEDRLEGTLNFGIAI